MVLGARRQRGKRCEGTTERWAVVLALMIPGCRDDGGGGETGGADGSTPPSATTDDAATSTGEVGDPGSDAADQCSLAPRVTSGRHLGTLRGNVSELDGACGAGGPDAFFRLDVARRSDVMLEGVGVGFLPRIGVLPHTCTTDWSHRTMLCNEGVGAWLLDVPAGASLVVSVGIDPEHPALGIPPPMEGDDPLKFAVDITVRRVLEAGESCEPAGRGRCGSGMACLPTPPPEDEPEAPPGPAVCTVLPGDTCGTAVSVPIMMGLTTIELDPADLQTDAHVHSCGGGRRRERVLALSLPEPGPHTVQVREAARVAAE
ncbi:MAG: hypothetical protein K0V04_09985, partial [Deltaproteobacteria bacterium]|nr:hypothetical protein [Deltaproteobacteria bacterium]